MTQQKAVLMNANHELTDANIEVPTPDAKDVLVKIQAVAANPVDVKQLESRDGQSAPKILGYDAVGQVVALGGSSATKFQIGDRVVD